MPALASPGGSGATRSPATPPADVAGSQPRDTRLTVIKPAPRWPHLDFRELWHYRELLARLAWRDIAVRYKQTSIGVAWAILQPLLTMVVFTLRLWAVRELPVEGRALSRSSSTPRFCRGRTSHPRWRSRAASLVSNRGLVTKVYFPRILLPLAGVTVPIVDFLLALSVLVRNDGLVRHVAEFCHPPCAPVSRHGGRSSAWCGSSPLGA